MVKRPSIRVSAIIGLREVKKRSIRKHITCRIEVVCHSVLLLGLIEELLSLLVSAGSHAESDIILLALLALLRLGIVLLLSLLGLVHDVNHLLLFKVETRTADEVALLIVLVAVVRDCSNILERLLEGLSLNHKPLAALRSEVVHRVVLSGLLLVLDDGVDELVHDTELVVVEAGIDVVHLPSGKFRFSHCPRLEFIERVVHRASSSECLARLVEVELDRHLRRVGSRGLLHQCHISRMLGDVHLSSATFRSVVLHLDTLEARLDAPLPAEFEISLMVVIVARNVHSVHDGRTREEVRLHSLAALAILDLDSEMLVEQLLNGLGACPSRYLHARLKQHCGPFLGVQERFVLNRCVVGPQSHIVPHCLRKAGMMERNDHINPVRVECHLQLLVACGHQHRTRVREEPSEFLDLVPVESLVHIRPYHSVLILVCSDGHIDLVAGVTEDSYEFRRLGVCVSEHPRSSHIGHKLEIVEHIVDAEVIGRVHTQTAHSVDVVSCRLIDMLQFVGVRHISVHILGTGSRLGIQYHIPPYLESVLVGI